MVNGKEKTKRQKDVVYSILQECSLLQTDEFWKRLFDDLSRGKCPKGIMIYNGVISSTHKRNGFSYNIYNKTTAEELSEDLINTLKDSAYIYSSTDIENKDGDFQEANNEYITAKNTDSWKKIKTRKMRLNLIMNYVIHLRKKHRLDNRSSKELYEGLKDALFNYRSHKTEDVLMEKGVITNIKDFTYNKTTKTFCNDRIMLLDERKEKEAKDVLGSKWEKYVQNVIKSVVKEEA